MTKKLVQEVYDAIQDASEIVGTFEAEKFGIDMNNECHEYGVDRPMDSPIEQILYIAFTAMCRINFIDKADIFYFKDLQYVRGTAFHPQCKIGDYRVDFLATHYIDKGKGIPKEKSVVVECDSQTFHERTEKERRYEKQRDRFLISKGYTVFHFTGTEIMREPYRVASEVISHITGSSVKELLAPLANYKN